MSPELLPAFAADAGRAGAGSEPVARRSSGFRPAHPGGNGAATEHDRSAAAGRAAGYAAGWAAGMRAAQQQAAVEHDRVMAQLADLRAQLAADHDEQLTQLAHLAAAVQDCAAPVLAQAEEQLIDAALQLAEAILGVALAQEDTRITAAISRAIAQAPAQGPLILAVSPADVAATEALLTGSELVDRDVKNRITVRGDDRLAPGDAEVRHEHGLIDARIASAVARVRHELDVAP